MRRTVPGIIGMDFARGLEYLSRQPEFVLVRPPNKLRMNMFAYVDNPTA
jgi:hypothetical protein